MSDIGKDAHYYVAGAGAYYGLSFIGAFYPAWVLMLTTTDYLFGWSGLDKYDRVQPITSATGWGIIIFLVYVAILGMLIMNIRKTWGLVVFLYLVCLFPFIMWLGWLFDGDISYEDNLFPGVNWLPWI